MTYRTDLRVSLLGFSALCMAASVALALSMAATAFPAQVAAVQDRAEDGARREALRIAAEAYGYRLEPAGKAGDR